MATNDADIIPDDSFPINFEDKSSNQNKHCVNDEVVLTPPPVQLRPPTKDPPCTVQPSCTFNEKTLERLLVHSQYKIKMSRDANKRFAELMRIYSVEVITRAGEQATKEGSSKITLEHLEKVLPQFLLDFN